MRLEWSFGEEEVEKEKKSERENEKVLREGRSAPEQRSDSEIKRAVDFRNYVQLDMNPNKLTKDR